MPAGSWRDWLALFWVAIFTSVVSTAVVATMAYLLLVSNLGIMTRPGGPPLLLDLLLLCLLLAPAMVVGLVVGAVAGLRRWWLVLPAVSSALGAVAAGVIAARFGQLPILFVLPGLVVGSLLAVALAAGLGRRKRRSEAPRGIGAPHEVSRSVFRR
jgi:hypothetical protein